MKIVKPWVQVENYDAIKIMKNIERACRTCYRSENLINEESYKKLLKNCLNRGHESILEHEKITVRMYVDIGVYKDLTRHRAGTAFSIESTRYCNYGKDKFDNEIRFIEPIYYMPGAIEDYEDPIDKNNCLKTQYWKRCCEFIEQTYLDMTNVVGATPDEMRMILPHSTAAEVTMTCNIREWRHIFSLRCAKMAHPAIRQVLIPLLLKFKEDMPELFGNIEYDTDFPVEKYAEISLMND